MDGPVAQSPHEVVNPSELAPPQGFSHGVVAGPGRTIFLGGQAGHGADGHLQGVTLVEQFDAACAGIVATLAAAGAGPEHLVTLQIFVTDADAYRGKLGPIGEAYRRHFGKHYPTMGLFEVNALFDPDARVELMGVAVVPELPGTSQSG
jgi:enamine deaminase RidA (YjgF/YER057c/UK114 family)